MSWVTVPGSNGIWQYENTATALDTYSSANGNVTNGIRSFTPPNGGNTQETYIKVRKTSETQERGELSKNYYDARV